MPTPLRATSPKSLHDFRASKMSAGLAAAGLVASLFLPAPVALAADPAPEIYSRDATRAVSVIDQTGYLLNDAGSIAVTSPMAIAKGAAGLKLSVQSARLPGGSSRVAKLLSAPKAVQTSCYDYGPYGPLLNLQEGVAFPPAAIGGISTTRKVTVSNPGTEAVTFAGMATTSGDFTAISGCGGTLAAGQSCTIELGFSPTGHGSRSGELVLPLEAPAEWVTVPLTGKVANSAVYAYRYPDCIEFPPTLVGRYSTAQGWWYPDFVSIYNYYFSGGDLLVTPSSASADFRIRSNTCSKPLAPDDTCEIDLWFSPRTVGPIAGMLNLPSNSDYSLNPVVLLGTGLAEPQGTLYKNPSSVRFGLQIVGTTSDPQSITITNGNTLIDGPIAQVTEPKALFGAPVRVDSVEVSGDYAIDHDCRYLEVGDSCTINATFSPTATGDRPGVIQVNSDATNGALGIALSGTGAQPALPDLELSAYSVSFGNGVMGRPSEAQTITLRNIGGANLTILNMFITGDFTQSNNCPAILAPAGTCEATIGFQATIPGVRYGKFVVLSNALSGVDEAALAGNGCRLFGPPGSRLSDPVCN